MALDEEEIKDAIQKGQAEGIKDAVYREGRIKDLEWRIAVLKRKVGWLYAGLGTIGSAGAFVAISQVMSMFNG